jgi:dihydroflavonol-4-reductase
VKRILVTGATGMIGALVSERLVAQGDAVRTIARTPDGPDAVALRGLGVEVVGGDLVDMDCVVRATDGVDGVIHTAALRGLPGATIAKSLDPNVLGSIHVLAAATLAGGPPVVQLLTSTFFSMMDAPQSEVMPLDLEFRNRDPYSVTKRLAYLEGLARVQMGEDIRFMLPGAAYGPSPCEHSAMQRPNFNTRIADAILGDTERKMPMQVPFVLADDCAYVCVAALEKGVRGERYLAMGRSQDVGTIAEVCNRACEIAGVAHRVEEVPKERLDDPEVVEQYGVTMTTLAKRVYPDPYFDTSATERSLGYTPTPLDEGLATTIDWMRAHQYL